MALAVVPRRGRDDPPPGGDEPDGPPPSLADRLAEARRGEVQPRSRVGELSAAFDAAVREQRFPDAERLKAELSRAREALAIAEGTTRGLEQALAAVEQLRAAEEKALQDAQRDVECNRIIEDALAADKRAQDGIEAALAEMRASLDAARSALLRAKAWEGKTAAERARAAQARATMAAPPGAGTISWPTPAGSNRASVIAQRDPLVRELEPWDGSWRI